MKNNEKEKSNRKVNKLEKEDFKKELLFLKEQLEYLKLTESQKNKMYSVEKIR